MKYFSSFINLLIKPITWIWDNELNKLNRTFCARVHQEIHRNRFTLFLKKLKKLIICIFKGNITKNLDRAFLTHSQCLIMSKSQLLPFLCKTNFFLAQTYKVVTYTLHSFYSLQLPPYLLDIVASALQVIISQGLPGIETWKAFTVNNICK